MTKNGSISTASVSQKSPVERLNGSVLIAGLSTIRGQMGLSGIVHVGKLSAYVLGYLWAD